MRHKSALLIALSAALVTDSLRAGDSVIAPSPDIVANATYTDTADSTMNAPNQSTQFSGFYGPSVSGSNIADLALYNSGNGGVYTGVAGTPGFSRVADYSTIAQGQTTPFTFFDSTIGISGSNVAFEASCNSGGDGIYSGVVGITGATRIADATMTAPGQTVKFSTFYAPVISGGNIADLALYNNSNNMGVYTGVVGTTGLTRLADMSTVAPGQTTVISNFGLPSISGSNVAFVAQSNSGNASGVYTGVVGTTGLTRFADTSTAVPGQTTVFSSFVGVNVSGSNVGFLAHYNGGSGEGIYTGLAGTTGLTRIVDTSMTAPGQTGLFSSFGGPVISGNNLALFGNFSGGQGLYTGTVGTTGLTRIADNSTLVPGQATTFSQFSVFSISGSDVAFLAFYKGGDGIFLYHNGSLFDVAELGEPLFGSTITNFTASGTVALDGNDLSFGYVLADGVSGVATFMIPVVPEPSTWALLAGGSVGLLGVRLRQRHRLGGA